MTWKIIAVYLKGFLKITNKTKWSYLLCCCHDNTFATGPVLIKLRFPVFILTKDHLLYPIKWWELRQYGNHVHFKPNPPSLTLRGSEWGYLVFDKKRLELKEFQWQQHYCGVIWFLLRHTFFGAKLEKNCFNISRDILYLVFYPFSCTT